MGWSAAYHYTTSSLCHRLTSTPFAGRDSTQDFIDINHSKTATKLLDKFAIGDYAVRKRLFNTDSVAAV